VPTVALYARVSTSEQDPERQLEELREFATENYPDADTTTFADTISGTEAGEAYTELWDAIGRGEFDAVVVHEISRLSRVGAGEIADFIRHALEHDTAVESLDVGLSIRVDDPEIQQSVYTMVANIMGDLAKIERQQTLRRIRSGIRSAREAGKWTGRPPVGFRVEDGYLRVEPEEFLRAQDALQRVLDGEPIVDVADEVGIAESTLRRLRDERRELYLDAEPDDERVATALDEAGVEEVDTPTDELEELRERVENLEEEAGK
jgi:DNA invertase Pin-like site-specific DNA recombinase